MITWGIIAPVLDIVMYKEPANKVFLQGATAGIINGLAVAVLGTILIYGFSKTIVKEGSSEKRELISINTIYVVCKEFVFLEEYLFSFFFINLYSGKERDFLELNNEKIAINFEDFTFHNMKASQSSPCII